jgi:hypothetical protein
MRGHIVRDDRLKMCALLVFRTLPPAFYSAVGTPSSEWCCRPAEAPEFELTQTTVEKTIKKTFGPAHFGAGVRLT